VYARGINYLLPHGTWWDPSKMRIPPEISWRNPAIGPGLPDYNRWAARCETLLRAGRHVADIAVLYPIDDLAARTSVGPQSGKHGKTSIPGTDYYDISRLLTGEVKRDFTFLHPETVNEHCVVDGGEFVLNNVNNWERYRVVILPACRTIRVGNLTKIRDFLRNGGRVIATTCLPERAAEFGRDAEVQKMSQEMFGRGGNGIFVPAPDETTLRKAIDGLSIVWDVRMDNATDIPRTGVKGTAYTAGGEYGGGNREFAYIHRAVSGADVYYFSNSSDIEVMADVSVRGEMKMEFWDPHTGTIRALDGALAKENGESVTRFKLKLPAIRSVFAVGRKTIRAQESAVPCTAINPGTPWPATDALERTVPPGSEAPPARTDRFVGIFYFLTMGRDITTLPNDLSKILPQDPDILSKPDSPLWGGRGPYYWGQPLYGYYNSRDPWVLRRHAALLADAGIDVVIFDTTNRKTYPEVYLEICKVWSQMLREGGRTPRLCFMVNTKAGDTAEELYRDLYQPDLYRDLWFHWQGKPLLICDPKEASDAVKKFFTLRKAHWPFSMDNTHNAWYWEATYPQPYSYDDDPAKPEQVNVSVAQNLSKTTGKPVNMSSGNARGRSFHGGEQNIASGSVNQGCNFAEQWKRAFESNAPFVMITGWNEWTAGKHQRPGEPVAFVDQFDQEFSRDIEPVTGLHGDNYYCQMVANVRRYKGAPALPAVSPGKIIKLNGSFDQWKDVGPEFTDRAFDNDHRDFGLGEVHYTNTSGRNDLTLLKVGRDTANIYFYAKTREPLTPCTDANWMWLLIDADQNAKTGWEGYDFILNRTMDGQETWLEKNTGGWKWAKVAKVAFVRQGNELMLAVPRNALGLPEGDAVALDFKWWDNTQKPGDIMDAYLSGDAAPDGRFNYRYNCQGGQPR
jgi:hypothetical protein